MATLGSKLITKQMQWNANMTDQNHLGKALIAKPQKLGSKMDMLFSAQNYYSDNPMSSMLMGNSKTEKEITSTSWEWDLKGANSRPLVVMENVEPESNTTLGLGRKNFKIKLDENHFQPGDVISPGTTDKKYQCRIQNEVQRHGDGWIYTVRLASDDRKLFLPQRYVKPNTPWGKLYSTYEEGTDQSGSVQFSTPISLRNSITKLRKKYKITDYASTEVLAVGIPDSKGNIHKSWMRYAEVEFWMQWYREIERSLWYNQHATTVMGANGRAIRQGSGIQEQLKDSHRHYYTRLTTKLVEEFLMDIFYSRIKPGNRKVIKGYTGEYGMIQFHRAMQDWMNQSGFVKNIEMFTNKVSSGIHGNALEGGFQFIRYHMANGISMEIVHNPLYDDREINFEIDPVTGYPKESQRITFLDFTGEAGGSNIQYVKKKDGEGLVYVEGMYGPTGASQGGSSAHGGDYYEMHVEKNCNAHIQDVTKCGELILDRA